MSEPVVVSSKHYPERGTLGVYISGFALSVVFTVGAYLLVSHRLLHSNGLIAAIIGLAFVQFFVQLFFFLHLGREMRPRWKLLVLFFMIGVVTIIVLGSLWIMNNLNYRMTPQQVNQYLQNQDGGI